VSIIELQASMDALLAADDARRVLLYPVTVARRQPVHTVYVPADRFKADTVSEWGATALAAMNDHGPLPDLAELEPLVRRKLASEPIEDLRVDFEDGYGVRPDAEEDRDVTAAAAVFDAGGLPPFCGIRIKSLEGPVRARSVRTFALFLQGLVALPAGFRVTLPKVTSVAQVAAMVTLCAALEGDLGLEPGALRFEIQVETPQAILGHDGVALIAPMLHASAGRCVGVHYGTYDYSASLGIAAQYQSMEHPAADYAKAVLQVAAAGTGVAISDGSTNILPVGDRAAVRAGWSLHARLVQRSLQRGFYQGWDLHPAQLPTRYAATYKFYLGEMPAAVSRLTRYLEHSSETILDEPATARALAGFLLRGLQCGGFDINALAGTGLDLDVLNRLISTGV
jgi:citrate lyase beta subunit